MDEQKKEQAKELMNTTAELAVGVTQKVGRIFTVARLKKVAAALVVMAIVGAGGSYMVHTQKVSANMQKDKARTIMLQNYAKENNIHLISIETVKRIAADHIGADMNSLEFTKIKLKQTDMGKQEKHSKRIMYQKYYQKNRQNNQTLAAVTPAKVPPLMYYDIECIKDNLEFDFDIDAQTGKIIKSDVDSLNPIESIMKK